MVYVHCCILLILSVYSKSPGCNFDWRKIDLKVPYSISLPWMGTMTVSVGLPIFLYLACDPLWEIKKKPFLSRVFNTSLRGNGLGMLQV